MEIKSEGGFYMKKRIILMIVFALLIAGSLFAEKYRYCMLKQNGSNSVLFLIMQTTEKLSDDQVKNLKATGGGSLNSKQDRFAMEAGLKNVKSYYYSGALQPVFLDYTKNPDDPDMKFLDSWEEVLQYIRWQK